MPRINLLPVRAAKRFESARQELIVIGFVLLLMVLGLFAWARSANDEINELQAKITELAVQTTAVEKKVTEVDDFKKKSATLERKISVIDRLKRQKTGPAKMLSDLADIATKQHKIWLTSFEDKAGIIVMQGGAMEQENISELQISLAQQSHFFKDVTLTLVSAAKEGGTSYFQWTICCTTNDAAG